MQEQAGQEGGELFGQEEEEAVLEAVCGHEQEEEIPTEPPKGQSKIAAWQRAVKGRIKVLVKQGPRLQEAKVQRPPLHTLTCRVRQGGGSPPCQMIKTSNAKR